MLHPFPSPSKFCSVSYTYTGHLNMRLCCGPNITAHARAIALPAFNPLNPPSRTRHSSIQSPLPEGKYCTCCGCREVNPNTTGRMTPKALLNVGMAGPGTSRGYFGGNKLFKICVGLGSSGLMMDEGRAALLRTTDVQRTRPQHSAYHPARGPARLCSARRVQDPHPEIRSEVIRKSGPRDTYGSARRATVQINSTKQATR